MGGFIGVFVICVNVFFFFFSLSAFSVTWRKSNVEIRSDAFHVVKAEGERHSLVIKQMRPNDAGSYCVTAVNAAGRASCGARLYIQSGETRARSARIALHAQRLGFDVGVAHLQARNTTI